MSQSADEYPTFRDADVLIVSMSGKIWKLHSRVLAVGSDNFKAKFEKHPPSKIRREDRLEGNLIQWKFQMIKHPAAARADPRGLHYADFMALDPRKTQPIAFGLITAMADDAKFDAIYDNVFRIFYDMKPDFTRPFESDDPAAPMHEALNLLTAAGYLQAYPAVRKHVESFLLNFNQFLWYQIEHRPEVWASVACKLQSPVMFREAMLHLAGKWHLQGADGVKQEILRNIDWGDEIFDLARQKGRELKDYKLQAERYLFEYVPERMRHEAKVQVAGIVAPGRNVYANDVYWWMSLHLIRQYFVSAVLQNRHHRAVDGGIAFYRTIAAPHSYLLESSLDAFHTMFAMTPKSRAVFVHALNELKKDIAPIVHGLLVNHSMARKPQDAAPYKYLTCTVILDEELPWGEKAPPLSPLQEPMESVDDKNDPSGDAEDIIEKEVQPTPQQPSDIPKSDSASRQGSLVQNNSAKNDHEQDVSSPTPNKNNTSTMSKSKEPLSRANSPQTPTTTRPPNPRKRPRLSVLPGKDLQPEIKRHRLTKSNKSQAPESPTSSNTLSVPQRQSSEKTTIPVTQNNARVLSDALALNLIPATQRQQIHAEAEAARQTGQPNMQGLLEKPFGKTGRYGLNRMLEGVVRAGIVGGDSGTMKGGSEGDDETSEEEGSEEGSGSESENESGSEQGDEDREIKWE